jgi:hypothetical protein
MTCHYCGQEFEAHELRPYAPGGSMTCFPCATSSDHEAETERRFNDTVDLMADASPSGTVVLDSNGLSPLMSERS